MRTLGTILLLATTMGPALAQAHAPTAAQTAQRDRMKSCNADAGSQHLTGSARKGFMSECLAGESAAPGKELTPQQARMTSCNVDASAKSLKGAERRSFLSTCLKG